MSDRDQLIAEIPSLRRYARALTGSADAADDLVQDCLERACSRWHLWQRDRALRPWLFTMMRNLFISGLRSRARRPRDVPVEQGEHKLVQPANQPDRMALRDLARALPELPAEQREVVLLIGLEGFTYAEVAAMTEVPVGTVMSRLSRGRERLRRLMAGDETPLVRRVK